MICRRSLLFAGAFLATSVKIPNLLAKDNPRRLALWAGSPPGGGGPNGPTDISKKGAVTNIAIPGLEIFAPDRPNGSAMIIAGGGGYKPSRRARNPIPPPAGSRPEAFIPLSSATACRLKVGLPGRSHRFRMCNARFVWCVHTPRTGRSIRTGSARSVFQRAATSWGLPPPARLLRLMIVSTTLTGNQPVRISQR